MKRVRPKQPITHAEVLAALSYDPLSGQLAWRHARGGRTASSGIGCLRSDGYMAVSFKDNKLLVHRLIWFIVTGTWPNEVDHIDGDRTNNRWGNLRDVVRAENRQNLAAENPNNKSTGLVGASFDTRHNRYRSYIVIGRKQIHLGYFDTAKLAHTAYLSAKASIHTHNDRMLGEPNVIPCPA